MNVLHSFLLFVFSLLYVYYVGYHLQHHQETIWSNQRLFLVFLPLIVFLFYVFLKQDQPLTTTSLWELFRPLSSWTVWVPLLLSLLIIFYASMASQGASITMNVFQDPVMDVSKGQVHATTPNRIVSLVNWSLVLCGIGILLFGLTLVVTIFKFQRNELGFLTHLILYLPCLISEWLQGTLGEKTSVSGNVLSGIATAPKSSIVAAILLVAFSLGFWKSLDIQRSWEETLAKVKQLSSGTASMAEMMSPDRKETITLIPATTDQRLHEPITLSLASAILMRPATLDSMVPLKPFQHIWAIRFRLFLNSQQSFFYRGELDSQTSLFERSRNILSFGEEDPLNELRTDLTPVNNYLEVRVCDQGLFLLSQWLDFTPTPPILPISFQTWHDVVIQHSGRRIDVAIDGKLLDSQSTSTIHAPSAALLSPETVSFHLGQPQFHGVLSNLTIAFNQEYLSKNFDHDPLFDRS